MVLCPGDWCPSVGRSSASRPTPATSSARVVALIGYQGLKPVADLPPPPAGSTNNPNIAWVAAMPEPDSNPNSSGRPNASGNSSCGYGLIRFSSRCEPQHFQPFAKTAGRHDDAHNVRQGETRPGEESRRNGLQATGRCQRGGGHAHEHRGSNQPALHRPRFHLVRRVGHQPLGRNLNGAKGDSLVSSSNTSGRKGMAA